MNFLVDAQLPRRLAIRLRAVGHQALHTLELPDGNRTTDFQIVQLAAENGSGVISMEVIAKVQYPIVMTMNNWQ